MANLKNYGRTVKIFLLSMTCVAGTAEAQTDSIHQRSLPLSNKPWRKANKSNLEGNMNNIEGKYRNALRFPALVRANPRAGRTPRIIAIAPFRAYRDVAELSKRLQLEIDPLMTNGYRKLYDELLNSLFPDVGDPGSVYRRAADVTLAHSADALMIGKIPWNEFPAEQRHVILDKVRAGCGLLYVSPELGRRPDGVFLSLDSDDGVKIDIPLAPAETDNYAVSAFSGSAPLPELEGRAPRDTVLTGHLGNGRIVVLDFSLRANYTPADGRNFRTAMTQSSDGDFYFRQCLTPQYGFYRMPCSYEYLMSLVGKSLLWCAKAEPTAKISSLSYSDGRLAATLSGSGGHRLTAEMRRPEGITGTIVARGESMDEPIALPLPSGGGFADAFLYDAEGRVLDWRTLWVDAPAPVVEQHIAALEPESGVVFRPGQPITGRIRLARPFAMDERLILSVIDNFGRKLAEQSFSAPAADCGFSLVCNPGRSVAVTLKAERRHDGEIQEMVKRQIVFANREFDGDYLFVSWNNKAYCRGELQDFDTLRRLGVDAVIHVAPELYTPLLEHNLRLAYGFYRITPHNTGGGFSSPKAQQNFYESGRRQAAALVSWQPVLLSAGDEPFFGEGYDGKQSVCLPRTALTAMRIFGHFLQIVCMQEATPNC